MKNEIYTKGPWRALDTKKVIRDADNNNVCLVIGRDLSVTGTDGQDYSSDIRAHNAAANAILIAAAPEMLKALESYISAWDRDSTTQKLSSAIEDMRDVVKKAKGI